MYPSKKNLNYVNFQVQKLILKAINNSKDLAKYSLQNRKLCYECIAQFNALCLQLTHIGFQGKEHKVGNIKKEFDNNGNSH